MPGYTIYTDTLIGCCLASELYAAFSSRDLKSIVSRVVAYNNQYLFCDTSIAALQKAVNNHPDWFLFETESSVAKVNPEQPLPMKFLCFGVEEKLIRIFMNTAKIYLWEKARDIGNEYFKKNAGIRTKELYDAKDRYLLIPEKDAAKPIWILKKNRCILPAVKGETASPDMVCLYQRKENT